MASSLHHCSLPPAVSASLPYLRPSRPPSIFATNPATEQNFLLTQLRRSGRCKPTSWVWRLPASNGDEAVEEENLQDKRTHFDISRLEQYTEKVRNEVLRVHAVVDGEDDQVLIYKGFSSSLMRSTAYDPVEPVLPSTATIQAIDRIRGPFDPSKVRYIKGGRGLSWQQFQTFLDEKEL